MHIFSLSQVSSTKITYNLIIPRDVENDIIFMCYGHEEIEIFEVLFMCFEENIRDFVLGQNDETSLKHRASPHKNE